jgi:hypothetical protein
MLIHPHIDALTLCIYLSWGDAEVVLKPKPFVWMLGFLTSADRGFGLFQPIGVCGNNPFVSGGGRGC